MSSGLVVERFIIDEVAAGLNIDSLDRDEDLLASDVLDSHGILEIVVFLEESFGIQVADEDLVPENFQSVNSVVAFVERKKS